MKKYPFYTALTLCNELYGVELDEDTFETFGLTAWLKIGNKDFKMYAIQLTPECDPEGGWFVCLPCNCSKVEAVTVNGEVAKESDGVHPRLGAYTHPIELDIENSKTEHSEFYIPGRLIRYKELGNKLYFTENYPSVNILYKGIYADEEGLPYLSDREVDAIACYCAYAHDYKLARLTKDLNSFLFALIQKAEWLRLCDQARVPQNWSQNNYNEIIKVMTRWDAPQYTTEWKPIL